MPYVEGFGTWPFGEEWLWEAVAGVYLPMLRALREAPVTIGLTPVLCDQLEALEGEPGQRFLSFLGSVRAAIHAEDAAGLQAGGERELAAEVRRAAGDYSTAGYNFERMRGDLLGELRELAATGVELWTGSATHAVLPLVATDAGLRLQVGGGIASHEHRFGTWSGGFWLPECAYRTGLERDLAEYGVRCFCVDQTTALGLGSLDQLEPIATEAGPVAVPVDWELVQLVWDGADGYPANPTYRDYHGRTLHDLKPWNTGGSPYHHYEALKLARAHARDFVAKAIARLDRYREERGKPGLSCFALDTELLGHWWYEGMHWLRFVIDEARLQGLALAQLPEALDRHEPVSRPLVDSTWGQPKDLTTWDSPGVADIAFAARGAELRTVAAAAGKSAGDPALERAARELLALQASDWAFQVTHDLAADYPRTRVAGHGAQLDAALAALADSRPVDDARLRNLAPTLDVSPLFGI
ncbi:MAG: 1,4-alpha-glucan branching enzyme [Thermoleophilaceae bacterium]|jgi:1,4-alpha-glucan branching enzyme|nr:1,4-alpha-glucan branching enzyme [Thermoleophilaceae bacterium]